MNQPKKERFKTSVGGQALMEGIMMRGPKLICCAVRKPDGTIETKTEPTPTHGIWTKIPLVRGAISMIESLIMGYRYMMYSAQVSMGDDYDPEEEETAFEKWVGEHLGKKAEDALLACAAVLGGLLTLLARPRSHKFFSREGYIIVALAWVLLSAVGALPFWFSREIPSYADAFFETVSGFTTTGASILTDVEAMSHGLLFWRSFTHWVGGMGVLVFTMAVLPVSDGRAMHLMRAESPGPSVGKISSKIRDTAKILYAMYLVLTVVQTILLRLVGLPWYDALITAFGAAGTGGFSNRAASIGAYGSPAVEMITAVFMVLFGINFNVYFFLLIRHFKEAFACEEMRVYLGVIAASTLAVAGNIFHLYGNVWQSLRYSFFQVASIITTTGYATTDFNMWPTFSKAVLVLLMFFGACAGSTGGGIKISRIIIMCKTAKQDLMRVLHPHAVTTVRFEGKPLDDKTVFGVRTYMNLYLIIFVLSTMVVAINQFDLVTTFTAVASCLNNIGPGLELVGPMVSFADFSPLIKLVLSFDMLVGRLEIFPMLVLFAPSTWLRSKGHLDRRLRARNLF